MNFLEKAFYTAGKAVAAYDAPLLAKALRVDDIGRTLPTQFTGNNPAQWLSSEGNALSAAGYTNHGTAYSIVGYILALGQNLPWNVYRLVDDKPQKLDKHPLYDLIYRPNSRQSWGDVRTALRGWLLLAGNAYVFGVRPDMGSKRGMIGEVWVPDPSRVEVIGGGFMQDVTGYDYRRDDGSKQRIAPKNVLHFKFWNPGDERYGLSPIAAGIDAVTVSKAGLTARVKQYQNQGPPGLLSDETNNVEAWTTEQASGIQRYFDSFRAGRRRAGNLPIVTGKLRYTPMGLGPVDLDLLAAAGPDKDLVADLYHFPGQLLNGSTGTTYSNMSEAGKAAYTRCVIPLETQLRDGLNRWLGADYNDEVYLDYSLAGVPELQQDKKAMAEMLALCPYITTQRKQELMGEEVDESLPRYLFPASLVTLEDLQATPTPPDTAPPTDQLPN